MTDYTLKMIQNIESKQIVFGDVPAMAIEMIISGDGAFNMDHALDEFKRIVHESLNGTANMNDFALIFEQPSYGMQNGKFIIYRKMTQEEYAYYIQDYTKKLNEPFAESFVEPFAKDDIREY